MPSSSAQMDNSGGPAQVIAELTCTHGSLSRVYVGSVDGSVRAFAANNAASESAREHSELPLTHALWGARVTAGAITSVCAIEEQLKRSDRVLVLCGSSTGELVVLRNELETQRFQLEGAVQHICYYGDGEFVVGDLLGNLYGVTQYEIIWKTQLPMIAPQGGFATECFYPGAVRPVVKAITHAKLLDVEKTLSNYVLVATGQKHLLVTHRGKDFGTIPTRTPIGTLASFSIVGAKSNDEDVVLAAGEEGVIYRLVSYRDVAPKEMPDFRFTMEKWTQVPFPIAKLLPVKMPERPTGGIKSDDFTWICLGVDSEVVLFRGQERVKQWNFASSGTDLDFPVDLALVEADGDAKQQFGAIAFPDRIRIFPINSGSL
ncbi:hypothetical protein PHYBOEH_011294 [Phytophthora boehmeriae]|uniref:Uncharacterized protein n=1 Tax=Phytophthora boehmeriae TaxID=109152 RepID=A0A8T1VL60_9STRA|nr:hypothetical protein PHYBOEH_011294 [Phytophthora boehmeriae]